MSTIHSNRDWKYKAKESLIAVSKPELELDYANVKSLHQSNAIALDPLDY